MLVNRRQDRRSIVMVTALHHVNVTVPAELEDAAKEFYGSVLGLKQVPKPAASRPHQRGRSLRRDFHARRRGRCGQPPCTGAAESCSELTNYFKTLKNLLIYLARNMIRIFCETMWLYSQNVFNYIGRFIGSIHAFQGGNHPYGYQI